MQSNIDCIMDDINEFPDSWVELYNNGKSAVNLSGYKLGISSDVSTSWELPARKIHAGERVLIYCDKEGYNSNTGIHTDFRLESGKGCEIYLFKRNTLVDKVVGLKKQPAPNIAYGRKNDGSNEWGYMRYPTPGKANCGEICDKVLGQPFFNYLGRVMNEGEQLSLDITLPSKTPSGTVVRYTLDGSEPTADSPVFTGPLTISDNTVIRATLFCEGYLSPRSLTQSYLFFPTNRPLTLPVISIVTDSNYLYDSKIGIYVEGTYKNGEMNYNFDWRRPVNFEFFEEMNTESALNQLTETRITGKATRANQRKSLCIYAHKRFGEKRLNYEFFPNQRPGVMDFKSVTLRNAGNDFNTLYMRDAIIQRTMATHADLDWQAWRPAIVYINGEYTGILNIRERSNDDNIYTNYGGLEDIDMIENWYELKCGTIDQSRAFRSFYSEKGHTLAEYEEWMDCEEFANLMIMNLYFDNRDFPGGNIVMWRPSEEGGRWRWIAKDTDFGMGLHGRPVTYNTIAWMNDYDYDDLAPRGNRPEATLLFRNLMEDEDFFRMFTDRCMIYTGDFLNKRGIRKIWDPMYEMIKTENPYHRALIPTASNYDNQVYWAKTWIASRTDIFHQYLAEYYNLEPLVPFAIEKNSVDEENNEIFFNGVKLSEGTFDGKYFQGRDVTLNGKIGDREIIAWQVDTETEPGSVTSETVLGDIYEFTMPECQRLTVTPLSEDAMSVFSVTSDARKISDNHWYTLDGRRLDVKPTRKGIYIQGGRKIAIQ